MSRRTHGSAAAEIRRQISTLRHRVGKTSLHAFSRTYLSAHFRLPPSPMHRDIFAMLETVSLERNARIAVAAPRGHAKSTVVSLAYVLWCICYGLEPYILLISNTADQSVDLLTAIKGELESNQLLIEDFPDAAEPLGARPGPERWRKGDIITRNGVKVLALGAGQKVRGRRHREHRPSLIILDDIESEADACSADQRESKMEWFKKAVMKAGTTAQTNVVVVGTLLHYEALLAQLLESRLMPGWTSRKYQAILSWAEHEHLWEQWRDFYTYQKEYEGLSGPKAARAFYEANKEASLEGTSVLWPEREDYYQLMELLVCEGRASFDSEKQNEPVDPASCFFSQNSLRYWDDEYSSTEELLSKLGGHSEVVGACDPSLGIAGKNRDDTAIVTLLHHKPTGHLYVLDADIRRRKPTETIDAILEYHRIRKFKKFGIETNQFQHFLASEVKRISAERRVDVPVKELNHTSDKLGRIQSLEPLVSTGTLKFARNHRVLLDQLRQFPKAAHDDGPDALEMAVDIARRPKHIFVSDPI